MIKYIFLGLLSLTTLFGANNLFTIVEQNSLTKLGDYNLVSINGKNSISISEAIKTDSFKNISPYSYIQIENYKKDLNVIVMIGEKTIQYGSIYSKGFGEKYNINTFINLLKKQEYNLALNTLDTFNQDDLIFIRNGLYSNINSDFDNFKNYIKKSINDERQFNYLKKIDVIYQIVDYANTIYDYTLNNLKLEPINNVFFDIKEALTNPKQLNATKNGIITETKPEFELVNNKLIKRCLYPNLTYSDSEEYYNIYFRNKNSVYYSIKDVLSIDLSKPLTISQLYLLTHEICPTVTSNGKKKWKLKYTITYPTIPSISSQRDWATSVLKKSRNQGLHTSKIKTYYDNLEKTISPKLKKLNDIGIVDGKLLHISYSLMESIRNEKVSQGVVKYATTGTIFRDKLNIIASEGIDYNIKNLPQAETQTYSEMTKDDISKNKYGTLYYFYNTKLQDNSPIYDDFHLYSSLTPNNSKNSIFLQKEDGEKIAGGEVLWISNNSGTPIQPYLYYNTNSIINNIDSEIVLDETLIDNATSFLRSEVDIWGEVNVYPLNIKTIKTESIPINNLTNGLKYFGPIFKSKVYLDKFSQMIKKDVPLDCSKETCTEAEKKATNPTKTIEEEKITYYCGASFTNPDTINNKYEVLQSIQNRFIEESFGDVMYHYNQEPYEEVIDNYISEQKVPNYYQYFGEVENKEECLNNLNRVSIFDIKKTLVEENALDFKFKTKNVVSDMLEEEQDEYLAKEELIYSFTMDILNNMNIVYDEEEIEEKHFIDKVSYEETEQDTFQNFFSDIKSKGTIYSEEGNQLIELMIPQN